MELLHMSKELPLPMALPTMPVAGRDAPQPVLRSTSLARMEELQQFLRQCDDKAAAHKYYKMLSTVPQDVLAECARRTKERAAWLAAEEQREYKRAKLLHVMGTPCSVPAEPPASSADADAFATGVLVSSPEKRPEGGALPEGPSLAAGAAMCASGDYATPQLKGAMGVGAATALPRMQQEAAAAINAGVAAAAISPADTSPPLAAIADQRISPEGTATASGGMPAIAPASGMATRSRQGTLRK